MWNLIEPIGGKPSTRSHHSSVIFHDFLYIFGGHIDSSKGPTNKVWRFNLKQKNWELLSVFGEIPMERSHHSCCLNNDCMIVFGGYNSPNRFNDLYSFNLKTFTWTKILTNGTIKKISEHSATMFNNSMYIFGISLISLNLKGGFNGRKIYGSLKEFNFSTLKWRKIDLQQKLMKRYLHTTIILDNSLIVS
jgi:N-acetylneuraminic acid mutarotase